MLIGIMGTPVSSDNLGCMALTYSLLSLLNEIEKENDADFKYLIFDGCKEKVEELALGVGIDKNKIISGHMGMLTSPLKVLRHIKGVSLMMLEIKKCDCIIDLTGGDSFSDIYGDERFVGRTRVKEFIEKINKPLLLGPQTYGPFIKDKNRELAAKVIKNADTVVSRDKVSLELIKKLTGREGLFSTDLAFRLPYKKDNSVEEKECKKLKIGINVSGLLSSNQVEVIDKGFSLALDYDKYICDLLEILTQRDDVEVYMIPHVSIDDVIHKKLKEKFSRVHVVNPFDNPVDIKSYIAKMDVFIGARMHGTIAAFTTGVTCIPTAYSRKFSGLFQGVGYDYIVDLQKMNNDQALNLTLKYIESNEEICTKQKECLEKCAVYNNKIKDIISAWLLKK